MMKEHSTPGYTGPQHRVAVAVFFFLAGFTFASWASRIPQIQAKLDLSEGELGTVLLALPAGLMVSLFMAGALVTRFGSRPVLVASAVAYSIILIGLGLAPSVLVLVAGLFLFGMAGNLYNIAVNTQAVGVEKMYGRSIMASFHGIWSLAGFTGAAVGLLMVWLDWLPWQHFLAASLAGLVVCSLFARRTLATTGGGGSQPAFALPDRSILQLGVIAFGCLVVEGTMFDWSGVYFKKAVQAPPALTSLGYAAFMGCMAAGRFVADRVVMRLGSRTVLQASGVVLTTGLLIAVIFPTLWAATAGFMLVGFGVSSVVPIVYSRAGQSKTMNAGQALAAVSTVGFLGFLAGPPLIGFIAEAWGLRLSFGVVAGIGFSTAILARTLPKS